MYHKRQWTTEKITQRLRLIEPYVYRRRAALAAFQLQPLPDPLTTPDFSAALDPAAAETLPDNTYWGRRELDFVLESSFSIPADWPQELPLALYLPLGEAGDFSHPEALVYIDGEALAACDRHHQEVRLPARYHDGQPHRVTLHGWTGIGKPGDPQPVLFMRPCEVVQIDPPLRAFCVRVRVALGVAQASAEQAYARGALLNALEAAFKHLDTRDPLGDALYASVEAADDTLSEGIAQAGMPLPAEVVSVGHAHIDVAWLWTLGQTRRKAGRTFHTVLHLMDEFPAYTFTQSQPQLYDYVRRDYPDLFARIKDHVQAGRWELIGGMWVEADCNLSGAESLARQFVLGRGFFREHFGAGKESPVLWLPDVFGYAWALPQLIKQAGLEYFFTIKIGWNQYNKMPYDTFWWQGIDGTRVLTHFSTTPGDDALTGNSTYNASASPAVVMYTWNDFQQKELHKTLLMSYGYGDGGGGPTREMLENIRELSAFPGAPQTRHGSVHEFFEALTAEVDDRLPTWNGELYLELHRGTYTTQARNKRANRKSEFLLHDAEWLAALAAQHDPTYRYPVTAFREAWQIVCLNQFHDIIPGSSITTVYTESLAQYAALTEQVEALKAAALAALGRALGGAVLLANPTSFTRSDLALWRDAPAGVTGLRTASDTVIPGQRVADGLLLALEALPALSVQGCGLMTEPLPPATTSLSASPTHLENTCLRVELNADGDITRIYDKRHNREVLPTGAVANQFQIFEDRPLNWDAWDVYIYYQDQMWLAEPAASVIIEADGPYRATLRIARQIMGSPYTQRISLDADSPLLRIDTQIDWREQHMLLKVAFPVEVLATEATYEIQWGCVQRPTHWNTSWDWARFETCAQKWVDLSEGDYGVSLLNDCKYGHDIRDNVLRLSLLRAPTSPDPVADQGEHHFSYALLPHAGDWRSETIAAAYHFNDPVVVAPVSSGEALSAIQPFSIDSDHLVVETVKGAEDGRGVIVRLYESQRRRATFRLTTARPLAEAWATNLLEDDDTRLRIEDDGHTLTLPVRPFEIKTLRLVFE